MQYNEEQLALIQAPIDHLVVGASAAGSGKSTTIVGRAQRILREYTSGNLLIISFTRNAAQDLRNKLTKVLTEDQMRRVITGTFHSVMGRVIRSKAIEVGLDPTFSVVDEASTNVLYQRLIEGNQKWIQIFTELFQLGEGETLAKKHYNKAANLVGLLVNNATPESLLTGEFDSDMYSRLSLQSNDFKELPDEIQDELVQVLYEIFKQSIIHGREVNVVTYDQIIFISYLMGRKGLLEDFKNSLVHTIIDEFQDTNYLQNKWAEMVAGNKLTLVGDTDQSIYSFRGGRPHLLEEKAKDAIVYNLSYNYRSIQDILDIGNKIININVEGSQIRKPMTAGREIKGPKMIRWYHSDNDAKEADDIVQKIQKLNDAGYDYRDIAILVRSRMALPTLNNRLQAAQIPLNDLTKFADFMKSEVMVDTLNFLKIFTNPKDIYAFLATLDRPKRGIGPKAVETLEQEAKRRDMGVVEFVLSDEVQHLKPGLRKKVNEYAQVYRDLLEHNKDISLQDAVDTLLTKSGYRQWVANLKNKERYEKHIAMLEEIVKDYEEQALLEHPEWTLFDLATNFAFDMTSAVKEETPEGVTVSTIHGAKGLEWKVVFVVGIEDGIFPMRNEPAETEDERRLMYVATTRAQNILFYYTTDSRVTRDNLDPSHLILETGLVSENI